MSTPQSGGLRRKRTARACDQCRRRKTKCDGESLCQNCRDTGLECSYGRPIRQARGTQYVVHLENRLRDLEDQIRGTPTSSTNLSNDDPSPGSDDSRISNTPRSLIVQDCSSNPTASFEHDVEETTREMSEGRQIDDMVDTIDCANKDDSLLVDGAVSLYRGSSTGVEIVRKLYRLCNSFLGSTVNLGNSATKMANALDRSFPIHSLSLNPMTKICLPSEDQVYRWIDIAFSEAFALWPFIDRDSFNFQVQRLLRQANFGQQRGDIDHLALVHAVIALGQRYDREILSAGGDDFESARVRGIEHFGIAKALVGLTECSRSVTAVQAVMCMCLYLKSVSAQRLVHTYVSMASQAAHQLGLHAAANAIDLPPKERIVRQRVYITLRIFDGYAACSLGLPRNIRATEPTREATNPTSEDLSGAFRAADANLELLEILGTTIEKVYFTNPSAKNHGGTSVSFKKLLEADQKLESWERKHQVFAQNNDPQTMSAKDQLMLRYSRCFVLLMLYCPFLHHVTNPSKIRKPNAYACGSRGLEAAIQAVRTANTLKNHGLLNEAYALTVDVLAMAATTLLVVELGSHEGVMVNAVKESSQTAKTLLSDLAKQNTTAAQCLESLKPLYQKLESSKPFSPASVEELMEDFTFCTSEHSHVPIFNSPIDSFDPNDFMTSTQDELADTLTYPADWPYLGFDTFAAPVPSASVCG